MSRLDELLRNQRDAIQREIDTAQSKKQRLLLDVQKTDEALNQLLNDLAEISGEIDRRDETNARQNQPTITEEDDWPLR